MPGHRKRSYVSSPAPKPNLEYLKKQAKELQRRTPQGKLADAQLVLANEYGFPKWADLKAHVQALTLSPAEALKAAVCDSDAARVREVFKQYPDLRARIDDPLPGDGFGQQALFAAVQAQLFQVVRSPERPFVPGQESLEALLGCLLAKEERVGGPHWAS